MWGGIAWKSSLVGIDTVIVAGSAIAAVAYLLRFRAQPPSRRRMVVKTAAAAGLALATLVNGGPVTLFFFYASAAIGDAALAREDEDGMTMAMAAHLLSQIFLCMILWSHWVRMDAPIIAALGLIGIWIGYFMLLWGAMRRKRLLMASYSLGTLVAVYLSLGTLTWGQLAVVGMLTYGLSQLMLAAEIFATRPGSMEAWLASQVIWISYYSALLMFFVAFAA